MPHCAAIGCNFQSKGNKGSGISLHCFPHDVKLREVWKNACGREQLPKDPRLCSRHFTEDDFENVHRVRLHRELTGTYFKRRIKPGAVPTIFPHTDPWSRKREKARNTSLDADPGSELYHGSDLDPGSDLDTSTDADEAQDTDSEEETDTDNQPDRIPDLEMDTMPVDRMRMRPWLEEQIDSSQIPGLKWVNKEERIFQIPWLHGAHQNWDLEKDAPLFMRWAIHTGKHRPGVDRPNPRMWKSNFRCALNSLPDIVEVKDKHIRRGSNAFRVYKMLSSKGSMSKDEPAHEMDESNPDRVPSLHLVQAEGPATKSVWDVQRIQRSAEITTSGNGGQVPASGDKARATAVHQHQRVDEACTERAEAVMETTEEKEESETQDEPVSKRQRGACEFCEQSRREINRLLQENRELKSELNKRALKEEFLKDNAEKVKYYTGFPCFAILFSVFTNVEASLPATKKLSRFQMLLLTLMRLRLDLPVQHLCHLFNVSHKTLSSAFTDTVDVLHAHLGPLAFWPERHSLRATMPQQFSDTFGQRVAIVTDVFEIRIERRSNLKAHGKDTHTVKYLIGITPQGSISFISKGWGGRLSDKCITENCGLLNKLLPGDVVLADGGFELQDGERTMCAEVKMPSFTKGPCQLDASDVEDTRAVAHLRKRVERVIGTLRKKFKMLHATLPVRFVIPCEREESSLLDKMVNVCCILVNMCPSAAVKPLNDKTCPSNETRF